MARIANAQMQNPSTKTTEYVTTFRISTFTSKKFCLYYCEHPKRSSSNEAGRFFSMIAVINLLEFC